MSLFQTADSASHYWQPWNRVPLAIQKGHEQNPGQPAGLRHTKVLILLSALLEDLT